MITNWRLPRSNVTAGDLFRVGIVFALAWIALGVIVVRGTGDDWRIFWNAGHHLGAPSLLTEARFVYTPGAAWVLWPFAHMPLAVGYFCYALTMLAAIFCSAWIACKLYTMSLALAAFSGLAWFPFTIAILLGQNSPVALLLTMVVILGIERRSDLLAGFGAALLLYKPNDAVPFLVLFAVLRMWRSLAVVAISTPVWYLLSVAATSDWMWPRPFYATITNWYRYDATIDSVFSINVPGLLYNAGLPSVPAVAIGAGVFLLALTLLWRVPRLEAASVVPLLGIVCSPHAYGYEAILALPAIWLLLARANMFQVCAVAVGYLLALFYYFARAIHFDTLAIPVIGGLGWWAILRLRDAFWGRRNQA